MKELTLLIVVFSLLIASSVMAKEQIKPTTTHYLYATCMDVAYEDDTLTTSTYCTAFIQGAIDAHNHFTSYHNFPSRCCLPKGISGKKIAGIFLKFVKENPNFLEKPAMTTLDNALNNAFPCPESIAK
ncbi:Rap1a/Tai family immunity protein [Thermodesulfobacteriota bacterium]